MDVCILVSAPHKINPVEAHGEIVANAVRDLGQGVGRAWCYEHDVSPPSELYVQDGIADFVSLLRVYEHDSPWANMTTYEPFVFVSPDSRASFAYFIGIEECE